MPSISILIPCYNAKNTLRQALDSLVVQSLDDFEVIAVDDGSSDETLSILETYARQDTRFRIISHLHQGIIATLNAGLAECRAALVARMDSDDRAHPDRLARQVAYLQANPQVGLVSCQVAGFPQQQLRQGFRIYIEWLNSLLTDADIRREIFIESPLPHPSVTFRRELVLHQGGYQDQGWAEDYDLWLRLYLNDVCFAKLPEVLLDWREDPGRLTRTDPRYSLENFLRAKAHYLVRGPAKERDAVIIWGAGMTGRRLSKHLVRQGIPLVAFLEIDPKKIGRTLRGLPIYPVLELARLWSSYRNPILLVAVGARNARPLIRTHLAQTELSEGSDWWFVA